MCLEDTVRIPLRAKDGSTRAYVLIDAADEAWANQWRWSLHSTGCAQRRAIHNGKPYLLRMHRVLMGLVPGDGLEVDHINRDRLDNRRSNLRVVTHGENQQNQGSRPGSTSKYRGVSWFSPAKLWAVEVTARGKKYHLGYFKDENLAGEAARNGRARLLPYAVD